MGVKLARAFGAHVVLFTTSPGKSRTPCGSARMRWSSRRNADEMAEHAGSFDFILDAVAAKHDLNAYLNPAQARRRVALVGAPDKPLQVSLNLIWRAASHRSVIGGHRGNPGDARLLRASTDRLATSR